MGEAGEFRAQEDVGHVLVSVQHVEAPSDVEDTGGVINRHRNTHGGVRLERTLERRVLHEVGLAPQMLHRVFRFRRAFRLLDQAPPGTWAQVAHAAGYFDQAHLIREFHRFAGAAPTAFLQSDPALSRAMLTGEGTAA